MSVFVSNNKVSHREIEVLQLIASGQTHREIAQQLYISSSTVDTHKKNLLTKLNALNAPHLITLAFRDGLLKTFS